MKEQSSIKGDKQLLGIWSDVVEQLSDESRGWQGWAKWVKGGSKVQTFIIYKSFKISKSWDVMYNMATLVNNTVLYI